ncbi:methylated-DNA--[protein]-cysteine S-methyltransferase [Brevibacterium renqingii]|uniref:methylated-DNA--[protein]-cysteine S-methyltransferase n=1 Tax=Brevibacterium renqingii TaxID=2776916 RepID=UPI001AE0876D|nr:methylated-DNA--[protein]-cysteine S-methyltransferase [Brevibacterium renqingii]
MTTINDSSTTSALRLPNSSAPVHSTVLGTAVGPVLLTSDGEHLTGLYLDTSDEITRRVHAGYGVVPTPADGLAIFTETEAQLREYFAGDRTEFDLPLAAVGTEFQRSVWKALTGIPYGRTAGYGELAAALGRPGAARAVGAANGKNPISIVVPCHRVIGADGSLTGYAWGEEKKRHLLDLEQMRRRRTDGAAN